MSGLSDGLITVVKRFGALKAREPQGQISLAHQRPSSDWEEIWARILAWRNKLSALLAGFPARSKFLGTNPSPTATRCSRPWPRARAKSAIFPRRRIAAALLIAWS